MISSNPRLESVFVICDNLNIDDPIHWMNNTSPVVIDWWIAFMSVKADREAALYDKTDGNREMSPEDAGNYLSNLTK